VFTGLISEVGVVRRAVSSGAATRLTVESTYEGLELGESIAVDGVCLTVDRIGPRSFEADASEETLRRTTLGAARAGRKVNLERAVRPHDRLGGHLVTGHVDSVGKLVELAPMGGAWKLTIGLDPALARYVAEKGSITVDGVSLTVNGVSAPGERQAWFHVAIIPHTQDKTTLQDLSVGSAVNLEVDLVARYVARLVAFPAASNSAPDHASKSTLQALLETHGFGAP
jgi:riboflavin synthase